MPFISTTRQLIRELQSLPEEKFIIATDENDNEYVLDGFRKVKVHSDNNMEWQYALSIRKVEGRLKR